MQVPTVPCSPNATPAGLSSPPTPIRPWLTHRKRGTRWLGKRGWGVGARPSSQSLRTQGGRGREGFRRPPGTRCAPWPGPDGMEGQETARTRPDGAPKPGVRALSAALDAPVSWHHSVPRNVRCVPVYKPRMQVGYTGMVCRLYTDPTGRPDGGHRPQDTFPRAGARTLRLVA